VPDEAPGSRAMTSVEHPGGFAEKSPTDWSSERARLLQRSINELGLKIEGTHLERIVARLYDELGQAGIKLKPKVYLSDEWSCPDGVPVIGIPFYLADQRLSRIEDEMMDGIEAETEEEILGYLRHEAGHTFNYAYKLFATEEWERLFGPFLKPYLEEFTPQPFSRDFVRHIPGWYAQKHPDEDFSETFAVWLTPGSNWRDAYRDWGCYPKLLYVERVANQLGQQDPIVSGDDYDFASEELSHSIAEHYQRTRPPLVELPQHFDSDLLRIFSRTPGARETPGAQPAERWLIGHRRTLVNEIAYWTGLYDVFVRSLINHVIARCLGLDLWVEPDVERTTLVEFTAFATTLCMNKLHHGDFTITRSKG
jgi:hypothetical protein